MAMSYDAQSAASPVLVAFDGPAPQQRVTVFFRLILAIPAIVVAALVGIAGFVVVVISWFAALVTGRLPVFAAEFLPGVLRWSTRVSAYVFLMTDTYPPFTLEDDDAYPVRLMAQPGPLNRWAVLFRIILVIPAGIVQGIVQYGAFTLMAFVAWLIVLVNGTMPPTLFQAYAAVIRYQARVTGYWYMITSEYPRGLFGDTETAYFGSAPPTHGAYGVPGAYGGPSTYGPPPASGAYGAPPAPGGYTAAPPPNPAAPFPSAPQQPAAPVPPTLPGVAFTFGGPSHLWGYTDDRSFCGIWSATDLSAPPQMWPIGEQGEGWARFRDLEPHAVALADPTPPPPPSPWAQGGMPSFGAPPPQPVAGSPYPPSLVPADDPRWRLVLSPAARRLVIFILILGVILYGVFSSVQGSHTHTVQNGPVNIQRLSSQTSTGTLASPHRTATSCDVSPQPTSPQGSACVTIAFQTAVPAFATSCTGCSGRLR